MSKQWGHGHITGKVEAMKEASESIEHLRDDAIYAMALVNLLMETHTDRALVDKTHQAIIKSKELHDAYAKGAWHAIGAGMFVDTRPPITKKAAIDFMEAKSRYAE